MVFSHKLVFLLVPISLRPPPIGVFDDHARIGGQEDTAVSKPCRNFSSILVLNSCGASTFTSGVQDRIQRINSLRPEVSIRISRLPSSSSRNCWLGCHSRSLM